MKTLKTFLLSLTLLLFAVSISEAQYVKQDNANANTTYYISGKIDSTASYVQTNYFDWSLIEKYINWVTYNVISPGGTSDSLIMYLYGKDPFGNEYRLDTLVSVIIPQTTSNPVMFIPSIFLKTNQVAIRFVPIGTNRNNITYQVGLRANELNYIPPFRRLNWSY